MSDEWRAGFEAAVEELERAEIELQGGSAELRPGLAYAVRRLRTHLSGAPLGQRVAAPPEPQREWTEG
ncbi:MAG: hypothetical protein M3336_08830 [Chloroflexota bacterium]|nr:hypothetical protein [Chloroflexota bacterium]